MLSFLDVFYSENLPPAVAEQSKYIQDLRKRTMLFNGVTYLGGLMKVYMMKTHFHTVNGENVVDINLAYFPCRLFCNICLESDFFCDKVIRDTISVTESDFRRSLTLKRPLNDARNQPGHSRSQQTHS